MDRSGFIKKREKGIPVVFWKWLEDKKISYDDKSSDERAVEYKNKSEEMML